MNIYEQLLRAYGNHFQDLFSQIMKSKYGVKYIPTSTYGNLGDSKVDGVLNFDIAFAVYAPEAYSNDSAVQKIKSDFNGFINLKNNGEWKEIGRYIIVLKRERSGVTSKVINLITDLNKIFPVDIMCLDDIIGIVKGYQPFSEDGVLLKSLKIDVTELVEYIVDTDFGSEPFKVSLYDEIQVVIHKLEKKKYTFSNQYLEKIKIDLINSLMEIIKYLTLEYMHYVPDNQLLFNNNSFEAGEKLQNELKPETYRIRCELKMLLENLYTNE